MPKTPKAAIPGEPRLETCQECHGSFITDFKDIPAIGDYDGDGEVKSAFEEIGTLSDPVLGDSGLFGQLKAALHDAGIVYDPDTYPYFLTAGTTEVTTGLGHRTSSRQPSISRGLLSREQTVLPITMFITELKFCRIP